MREFITMWNIHDKHSAIPVFTEINPGFTCTPLRLAFNWYILLERGKNAVVKFGLDLPLDSTYSIRCTCEQYDNRCMSINPPGDALGVTTRCGNDSAITQSRWRIVVHSDKNKKTSLMKRLTTWCNGSNKGSQLPIWHSTGEHGRKQSV
jgi:hypothetical protein